MMNHSKHDDIDQKQDDKVWFYEFDEKTLTIEDFTKNNKDNDIRRYDNPFMLLNLVQNFTQNSNSLSEFKRSKINDFKTQKSELEKNKLRVGMSYFYETMIAHILENLDFYLRNEINLFKIKPLFKQDENERLQQFKQRITARSPEISSNFSSPRKNYSNSYLSNDTDKVEGLINRQQTLSALREVLKEEIFLNKCQDYVAIEKLYCHDFWIFQSEKQRYFRYFCTCVRLFFFFYELATFKDMQVKFNAILNEGINLSKREISEYEQDKEDLQNLFLYSYNETKYCLQLISKNFETNDSNSLGLNLLTLLLKSLLKEEFDQTRVIVIQKIASHFQSIKKEFDIVIEQSKSKANDIRNNQFKELELVKIVTFKQGIKYPVILLKKEITLMIFRRLVENVMKELGMLSPDEQREVPDNGSTIKNNKAKPSILINQI